jgi:hypothetical protein
VNVVAGAVAQRARALVAWRTREPDPAVTIQVFASLTARDVLIEWPTFCALFCRHRCRVQLAGRAVAAVGVVAASDNHVLRRAIRFRRTSHDALRRVGIGYYFALEAMALALAAFFSARLLVAIGLPEPTTDTFVLVPLAVFVPLATRVGYCFMRSNRPNSQWPGASSSEVRLWKLVGIRGDRGCEPGRSGDETGLDDDDFDLPVPAAHESPQPALA